MRKIMQNCNNDLPRTALCLTFSLLAFASNAFASGASGGTGQVDVLPVAVTAEPGQPPSDAIVLFDGTEASFRKNWGSMTPTNSWLVKDGALTVKPGAGFIYTHQGFRDCQLHIEWQTDAARPSKGQGRCNSGVIFMGGAHEIQVLDSFENPTYPKGQAGALYGKSAPLANPTRKPGDWQTYDIVFHAPTWDGDTLVDGGSVTVFFNGVLVQDHVPLAKAGQSAPKRKPSEAIVLQDHGNPVPYRNIWIRRLTKSK